MRWTNLPRRSPIPRRSEFRGRLLAPGPASGEGEHRHGGVLIAVAAAPAVDRAGRMMTENHLNA